MRHGTGNVFLVRNQGTEEGAHHTVEAAYTHPPTPCTHTPHTLTPTHTHHIHTHHPHSHTHTHTRAGCFSKEKPKWKGSKAWALTSTTLGTVQEMSRQVLPFRGPPSAQLLLCVSGALAGMRSPLPYPSAQSYLWNPESPGAISSYHLEEQPFQHPSILITSLCLYMDLQCKLLLFHFLHVLFYTIN